MFSTSDNLADFVETVSDDDEGPAGSARLIKPTKSSIPSASRFHYPQQQTNSDVLEPILSNQMIMLTDRNIQIKRDGTLVPSISEDTKRATAKSSPDSASGSVIYSRGNYSSPFVNSSTSSTAETSQAHSSPHSNKPGSADSSNCTNKHLTVNVGSASLIEDSPPFRQLGEKSTWNALPHSSLSGSKDDPGGTEAYEQFLYSADRKSPNKNDKEHSDIRDDSEPKNPDDDEDFNIYSDIEEDVVSQDPDPIPIETETLAAKENEDSSDSELIIDDRRISSALINKRESPPNADEEGRQSLEINYTCSGSNAASDSPVSNNFEGVPSPYSIPLPDSTPPPVQIHDEEPHGSNSTSEDEGPGARENLAEIISYSDRISLGPSSVSQSREEYDPSQPLTSSDEEDYSTKLTNLPRLSVKSTRKRVPINRQANAQKEDDDSDEDLSSIPMPSDDYKRPTIQFSIPTRHKLLSISSLIKRQRGVAKKENRNEQSFASEVSKAFGEDKNDDFEEDSSQVNQGGAKVSLVAEIFGSDEDDEEKDDKIDQENASASSSRGDEKSTTTGGSTVPTIVVPFEEIEPEDSGSRLSPLTKDATRWKKIITDVRNPESLPQTDIAILLDNDEDPKEDSDDSIAVIERIQPKKHDADDDIQVLCISKAAIRSRRGNDVVSVKSKPIETERHSVLENISDDSKESEQGISRVDPNSGTMCKDKNDTEPENKKESHREETEAKQLKRKRSHTPNPNHEDGEIVDSPEKGRKKKKDKKQRKNKEDKSRAAIADKKTVESNNFAQNSSEEENKSQRVFWRKSSNSTKERNYRDGKPKPEEKYFKTSDKKKDNNSKDHSEKNTKDSSQNDKGKLGKDMYDTRRISRRSVSRRSRSRSLSASRNNLRKFNSRSRRSSSANRSFQSRSRSRSLGRSRNRGRFSITPRRTRSGSSGSPRLRSRSPLKPKKNRRRSSSSAYPRRHKDRKRSESSSSSTSSKRERKRNRDRISGKHKSKKEKNKRKDKLQEFEHTKEKDKDREKDKDKRKRKKRLEKSVSPAKEIFADGDSIVVSLNFKKISPATATDKTPSKNEQEGEKKKKRNRTRHNRPRESAEGGKPRLLKKTLLIDLESSPVQEQNIGVSPTLIVLSDDENTEQFPEKNSDNLKERGKDGTSVSITDEICQTTEVMSPYKLGVPADSTQLQNSMTTDPKPEGSINFSFSNSKSVWKSSNLTPTRGESQVTSTRDPESGMLQDDDCSSPPRSPSGTVDNGIVNYPYSTTGSLPPTPFGAPPSLQGNIRRTNENASDSNASGCLQPSFQSSSNVGKPLIGNILGLLPSSGLSSSQGSLIAPLPNVIPIPPVPPARLESSVNQNMFTTNVLASMATALYAPILAARQQQQTIGTGSISSNMNSANASTTTKSVSSSGTVLLPKTQITQGSGKRFKAGNTTQSTGGGDSPFSPNSSDGDDLFEPPLDRSSQSDASTPNKPEKVNSSQTSNPTPSSASNANGSKAKPREKSGLFDSLFGPEPKKNSQQKGHSKSSKGKGSGGHHKSKSKKTKKEIVKMTEGELRLTEDVPNSAVELRVKEKFLMKLNRQDRVVEEVKLSLKPHYSKKHVTKEEYKEILRRAVPKICHNKSGEINPFKIKELVEAYVKKFRHSRRKE